MSARTYVPMEPTLPGEHAVRCDWFAMCDRRAVLEVSHPILGHVPTCHRCAERVRRADAECTGRADR